MDAHSVMGMAPFSFDPVHLSPNFTQAGHDGSSHNHTLTVPCTLSLELDTLKVEISAPCSVPGLAGVNTEPDPFNHSGSPVCLVSQH